MYSRIAAPNLSKGFWDTQFDMLDRWGIGKECCLIAENPDVIPVFKTRWPGTEFTCLGYDARDCSVYDHDMNVLFNYGKQFDSVFSQALIEHLSRPSIAIENMVNLCKPGGVVVIHTVEPGFQVHRYPVDCVRFLDDFWKDLCRYLPIELVQFNKHKFHVFAAYRRIG